MKCTFDCHVRFFTARVPEKILGTVFYIALGADRELSWLSGLFMTCIAVFDPQRVSTDSIPIQSTSMEPIRAHLVRFRWQFLETICSEKFVQG